ncbi:hypothetical protein P154DRAFT_535215 [Amniculicola lignicola CBS 123094]|uniref:Extracellular serine-rich protein n=1 Tax=Amniculicola lignicola CBS 123094 TaxID=1392246 RepID=A0A6A5WE32_9PLEO|nr:hypothetical protein P154DRAFT_535215 [Amniculicola lignicola CBS 123094]
MKASFFFALGFLAPFVTPCTDHTDGSTTVPATSFSTVATTSTEIVSSVSVPTATASASAVSDATVKSTILVIARDDSSAKQATSGLNAYGIPFETLIVPQAGVNLPTLNTTSGGNYGGIITLSGLAYNYGGDDWHSAITDTQWNRLYAYQIAFGVRMVQIDVYPQSAFGTSATGSCCDTGVEQLVSFSNTTGFPQAGLNLNAGMSTQGLYHYITTITDPSTTWEFARFGSNSVFSTASTAGVINNFSGREQMAFFITWATDWSPTSNYLQHAYITWMTRGLYAGYRRVNLNAQIDDMMLATPIYNSANQYRVVPADMNDIKAWVPTINAKMNPGSLFRPEIGYNGNGNIIQVDPNSSDSACTPGPIFTGYDATDAEWEKPLGTGVTMWPTTPTNYTYTSTCLVKDTLSQWFQTASNRALFYHLSHTYTHMHLNNATYGDVYKEISFNQKWLAATGLSSGTFSPKALIPPAITGLHNGDALQAMYDLGLRNAVGDNARPALRNQQNPMWPYITNTGTDGFNGFQIIPRWPLRIYWNCDSPTCTTQEWVDTSSGSGGFTNLMLQEKNDMMRYFFGGYRDGVMFHQINLRTQGMTSTTTADGTVVRSLYQAWVEQTVQEFKRLCKWPMISLKQDDLAAEFAARMARDQCNYGLSLKVDNRKIVGVIVTANGNSCGAEIPVTVPGSVTNTQGFRTEKLGNDPLTIWVTLSGSPVTLTLTTPVEIRLVLPCLEEQSPEASLSHRWLGQLRLGDFCCGT